MIAELAIDLIDKLKTVTALSNRVGMAAAGGAADPAMKSVPLPAAWVAYASDTPIRGTGRGNLAEDSEIRFTVAVLISYTDQSDLINTQLPTLETIVRSVSGKDSTNFALRWKYAGTQLVDVSSDRLVYEMSFTASSSYLN